MGYRHEAGFSTPPVTSEMYEGEVQRIIGEIYDGNAANGSVEGKVACASWMDEQNNRHFVRLRRVIKHDMVTLLTVLEYVHPERTEADRYDVYPWGGVIQHLGDKDSVLKENTIKAHEILSKIALKSMSADIHEAFDWIALNEDVFSEGS